jgi:hypothetical protein
VKTEVKYQCGKLMPNSSLRKHGIIIFASSGYKLGSTDDNSLVNHKDAETDQNDDLYIYQSFI